MTATQHQPPEQLLDKAQTAAFLQVHPNSLYRMVARKRLPPPARLSKKCVRWKMSDLLAWVDKKRKPA